MRISAGRLKGRNVLAPQGRGVRPTGAKAREGLFDALRPYMDGCRFLDLFAGSGAVGIEAYSRGAGEVVFCERNRDALPLLKQNVLLLKGAGRVFKGDSFALLERLPGGFDVIFADPPYKENALERVCEAVARRGLLAEGGVLVYEHSSDNKAHAPAGWRIEKSRKYGAATLEYLKQGTLCAVTGSFDPITRGHAEVVRRALQMFDKAVVVIAVNDTKPGFLPLEDRREIAEAALKDMPGVQVDVCEGLVYKYCNRRGINTIVRGVRGEEDREYEEFMARYNLEKGGVETVFISAEGLQDISSTALRRALAQGDEEAAQRLCAPGTYPLIKQKYAHIKEEDND